MKTCCFINGHNFEFDWKRDNEPFIKCLCCEKDFTVMEANKSYTLRGYVTSFIVWTIVLVPGAYFFLEGLRE